MLGVLDYLVIMCRLAEKVMLCRRKMRVVKNCSSHLQLSGRIPNNVNALQYTVLSSCTQHTFREPCFQLLSILLNRMGWEEILLVKITIKELTLSITTTNRTEVTSEVVDN